MNDSTTSREIARASLAWPFDVDALALSTSRDAVAAALDGYRNAMRPAKSLTKAERQPDQQSLAEIIRSIGLRLRPDFSEDQARMWIASIVDALEDQPLRVALAAAADAKHLPLRFPGEVHATLVERCEVHRMRYENAIRNLNRLLDRIDHPRIEASPEAKAKAEAMSNDELQANLGSMAAMGLVSFGLTGGWLIDDPEHGIRWATEAEQEAHAQRRADERGIARTRETVES